MLFDNGGWLEQTAEPFLMHHKRREPDAVLRKRTDRHTGPVKV